MDFITAVLAVWQGADPAGWAEYQNLAAKRDQEPEALFRHRLETITDGVAQFEACAGGDIQRIVQLEWRALQSLIAAGRRGELHTSGWAITTDTETIVEPHMWHAVDVLTRAGVIERPGAPTDVRLLNIELLTPAVSDDDEARAINSTPAPLESKVQRKIETTTAARQDERPLPLKRDIHAHVEEVLGFKISGRAFEAAWRAASKPEVFTLPGYRGRKR